jgi:hypothetical protein
MRVLMMMSILVQLSAGAHAFLGMAGLDGLLTFPLTGMTLSLVLLKSNMGFRQ